MVLPQYILWNTSQCYWTGDLTYTVLEVEKDFIEAAKRNDVEGMKLRERGVNVNAKNVVCQ